MPEREITTLEKKRSRRITLNMPIKETESTESPTEDYYFYTALYYSTENISGQKGFYSH